MRARFALAAWCALAGCSSPVVLPPDARSADARPPADAAREAADVLPPHPRIASLSPAAVLAGAPSFTLAIHGSGFTAQDGVAFGVRPLTPLTLSDTQITVAIDASLVATPGEPLVAIAGAGGVAIQKFHVSPVAFRPVFPAPAVAAFTAVDANGPGDVWLVGTGGTVLHTLDGGVTFTRLDAGTYADLSCVWTDTDNDVIVVGAGGLAAHYQGFGFVVSNSKTTADLHGCWGGGPLDVDAVGDGGTILSWDDEQWIARPSPTSANLRAVWGALGNEFAVGDGGTILDEPGTSFVTMTSPVTNDLYAVAGRSATDAYAAGAQGVVLHFDGTTWSVVVPPAAGAPAWRALVPLPGSDVLLAGDAGALEILHGPSASPPPTPIAAGSGGAFALRAAALEGAAGGPPRLLLAGDAGVLDTLAVGASIQAFPAQTTGDLLSIGGPLLLGTSALLAFDGAPRALPPAPAGLAALAADGAGGAAAVGTGGTIAVGDGTSWSLVPAPVSGALHAVAAAGGGAVVAVGDGGAAVARPGARMPFAAIPSGTTATLRAVAAGGGLVVAGGDGGAAVHGTTAGLSADPALGPGTVEGASVLPSGDALAVGGGGLFATLRGGAWSTHAGLTTDDLLAVAPFPAGTAIALLAGKSGLYGWDGAALTPLAGAPAGVAAAATIPGLPGVDLVAGAGGLAGLAGTVAAPISAPLVEAVASISADPSGAVLVGLAPAGVLFGDATGGWHLLGVALPGAAGRAAVLLDSPADGWAVNQGALLHFDGTALAPPSPAPPAFGAAAAAELARDATGDILAAGADPSASHGQAVRFDGSAWSALPFPTTPAPFTAVSAGAEGGSILYLAAADGAIWRWDGAGVGGGPIATLASAALALAPAGAAGVDAFGAAGLAVHVAPTGTAPLGGLPTADFSAAWSPPGGPVYVVDRTSGTLLSYDGASTTTRLALPAATAPVSAVGGTAADDLWAGGRGTVFRLSAY